MKLQLKFHLHQNDRRDERYIVPYMIIVLLMSIISFQSDPTIFVQVFSVLMWKVQPIFVHGHHLASDCLNLSSCWAGNRVSMHALFDLN